MNKLKVSVITPSFNSEQYLETTIQSVLDQSFIDWEMVIVDDCSVDRSYDIAQQYAQRDERIKPIKLTQNKGAAISRNKGIEVANGRYIAFLDSDDVWKPDKLKKQIHFMETNSYPITYTYYRMIDESGKKMDQSITPPTKIAYKDLLKSNHIGCLTAMYDTEMLGKVYMPHIRKRQDYGLWLKILKKVDFAYCLQDFLALYRYRSNSISDNKLELLQYNWRLFHRIEKLSKIKSAYYLGSNIVNKIFSSP